MREFIETNLSELINTIICLIAFLIIRFIIVKAVKKIGRISGINKIRTKLILKYISFGLLLTTLFSVIYIWKVDFQDIGIIFSSVFTMLGVALFATWSILSNVTAGIILFFFFPFKIGDRIKILDGDFSEEVVILDIKAYHMYLKKDNGELMTYPNNLLLQKGVIIINDSAKNI